jgi:hypothetical protein
MNKHFRFSGSTFQRLEEYGVSASAVLRRAGLSQGCLKETRALLKTEELFALWHGAIGEVSTKPAIGLQLGTETKTERFRCLITIGFTHTVCYVVVLSLCSQPYAARNFLRRSNWKADENCLEHIRRAHLPSGQG